MPWPRSALPPPTDGRAFTVRAGIGAGISRQQMRHPSLLVPTRRLRATAQSEILRGQAEVLALVLPLPWAYSHETAAELLELPLPRRWQPHQSLEVLRPSAAAPVRRPGVRGHRGLETRAVLHVGALPVTDVVDTWCDLGTRLALPDLVAAGDAALNRRGVTVEVFALAVSRRTGWRGAPRLAQAVPLLRRGSGSPMESKARLAFREGGLPEPALNADIVDACGNWMARGDFVWRDAKVVAEYEGDVHRTDRKRWLMDVARIHLLEDAGWRVIRITARDLSTPELIAAMVERIGRAIVAGRYGAS